MIVLTLVMLAPKFEDYKIVEIDRVSRFAGKMGREVRETWRVSKDGQSFNVIVMPYHTKIAGAASYSEGDSVTIHSKPRGGTIRVTLKEVSK